jgi:hypothetical protein
MSTQKLARLRWTALVLFLAGGAVVVACQPSPSTTVPAGEGGGVNVAREARLAETTQLEILEQTGDAVANYTLRATITDQAAIAAVVKELDRSLPLGPRARCIGKYLLRFAVAGATQEFEYFCQDGTSFLRGGQPFWRERQVQPPGEFDQLMARLAAGAQ